MLDDWMLVSYGSFLLPTVGFVGNYFLAGTDRARARKHSRLLLICSLLAMLTGYLVDELTFLLSLLSIPVTFGALAYGSLATREAQLRTEILESAP